MGDAPGATSWAESADIGYDDGYFSQPGAFMMSNYRDALCCFQPCRAQTAACVNSTSSVRCSSSWFGNEQNQQDFHSDLGIKTIQSFEARLKHLDVLNEKLSNLAQDALNPKSDLSSLSARLKQNRFFPSIRNSLVSKRKHSSHNCCDYTPTVGINGEISTDAGKCGAQLVSHVGSLQALEARTHSALNSMLRGITEELPLRQEEVESIIVRTSRAFTPAKSALASAIKEKTDSPVPRFTSDDTLLLLPLPASRNL